MIKEHTHKELSNIGVGPSDVLLQQWDEALHVKRVALCHNVLQDKLYTHEGGCIDFSSRCNYRERLLRNFDAWSFLHDRFFHSV